MPRLTAMFIIIKKMSKRFREQDESFHGAPTSHYSRITQHTKEKLCYLVIRNGQKVTSAAKILKINTSTAKMIIKKFYSLPYEEKQAIIQRGSKSKKQKNERKEPQKRIYWSFVKEQEDGGEGIGRKEPKLEECKVKVEDKSEQKIQTVENSSCCPSYWDNWVLFYYPYVSFAPHHYNFSLV